MRIAKVLAVGLLLTAGSISAAFALDPVNDQPNGAGDTSDSTPAAADSAETGMKHQPAANVPPQKLSDTQQSTSAADAQKVLAALATNAQAPPMPSEAPASEAQALVSKVFNGSPTATVTPAPTAADTSAALEPLKVTADDRPVYLPVADYIQHNAKKALAGTDADDRQILIKFYTSHMGATLWVDKYDYDKYSYTAEAKSLIAALQDADNWGLRSADFKIPDLKPSASGAYNKDDLMAVEVRLSLDAMEYARDAHGDRISDPPSQLGTYIDRKPALLDRRTVIDSLAAVSDKGAYLTSLNPQHEQFHRLRQKLVALRASKKKTESLKIPAGPLLKPGMSNVQITVLRKRLKVTVPPTKDDSTPADDTYYDKALGDAVRAYKARKGIRPESTAITMALRRSLNADNDVSEARLITNMEEWRWMPADLGNYHIMVNIPEFKFRVMSGGRVIHEERIVSGRPNAQSPIFSETMKMIVIQPRWNVPDSIKLKELLPGLRAGSNPLRRQGLVLEYNGRKANPYNIDWSHADIRNFNVYQPPGGGNALGVVKFLFPNKHAVYLHDTPRKSLFNEPVRAFSHGCMRMRNPVTLAELLLSKDKGWDKEKVDDLVKKGPEENEINLDHTIPVHVTYFTVWVDGGGEVQIFNDIYGHEKRITLALAGRWKQIMKADEKKVSPEAIPVDNWRRDSFSSLFGDGDYDDRGRRRKHNSSLSNFFKQVFGGF